MQPRHDAYCISPTAWVFLRFTVSPFFITFTLSCYAHSVDARLQRFFEYEYKVMPRHPLLTSIVTTILDYFRLLVPWSLLYFYVSYVTLLTYIISLSSTIAPLYLYSIQYNRPPCVYQVSFISHGPWCIAKKVRGINAASRDGVHFEILAEKWL